MEPPNFVGQRLARHILPTAHQRVLCTTDFTGAAVGDFNGMTSRRLHSMPGDQLGKGEKCRRTETANPSKHKACSSRRKGIANGDRPGGKTENKPYNAKTNNHIIARSTTTGATQPAAANATNSAARNEFLMKEVESPMAQQTAKRRTRVCKQEHRVQCSCSRSW
jgi:hypothetical protein